MKSELYDFDEVYNCDCDSHFLRITKFNDEEYINFSKLEIIHLRTNFLSRLKQALLYVINPEKFDIYGDLVFDYTTAKKISRDLLKLTQKNPSNFVTGKRDE